MKKDSPSSGKSLLQALLELLKCRLVRERGLEPPRSKRTPAPQAGLSTDSSTRAKSIKLQSNLEADDHIDD